MAEPVVYNAPDVHKTYCVLIVPSPPTKHAQTKGDSVQVHSMLLQLVQPGNIVEYI